VPRGSERINPTMTDVARLAGVSQSCVSLVLNDAPRARVPEATRLRVIRAAEKLGYTLPGPRRHRRPPPSEPGAIGFIVDEMSVSPHSVRYLDAVRDCAWAHERIVQTYVTRANKFLADSIISQITSDSSIAGVIYASSFTRQVEVPEALTTIPTVLLNCYSSDHAYPTILPNDVNGGFLATQHLILYGHRRIAMINGERWMDASQNRLRGYRQALTAAGIEFDGSLVKIGDWSVRSGYVRTLALMQAEQPPTAFYCANDMMAWGCLQALAKLGKSVPEDVSVVGHNDVEVAASTVPPLTSCRLPSYEMGTQAVEFLLEAGQMPDANEGLVSTLDCQLISRSSVTFRKGGDLEAAAKGEKATA
jgi:LacI family transcriptional regulator, galactose operon repressor